MCGSRSGFCISCKTGVQGLAFVGMHRNGYNRKKQIQKIEIKMIIVQVKEGENIEKALKKFKRKFEKTGIVKELRSRQAFEKPSVANRKKMMKAVYVQKLRTAED